MAPLFELKDKLDLNRTNATLSLPPKASIPSTGSDVFEAVGDVPRAVEAVGAEGPVGAQEADRQEAGEDAERGQQDQPQFRGWRA
jgi:hypothetical protein